MSNSLRAILPQEWIVGQNVWLRLATLEDCTQRYVDWLLDPLVNAYLETRWSPQTLDTVRAFVAGVADSPSSYLFAIVKMPEGTHIGNIKIGPVNALHGFADVSFFVGDRACWGRGYATEAIERASAFGFARLGLHRVQAGCYASNVGSARALEKAGFVRDAVFREQLVNAQGQREDCHRFGLLRSTWEGRGGALTVTTR